MAENAFTLSKENEPEETPHAPADFETAVSATDFGKFNILLLLIVIPSGLATSIESSTMSFVFPTAQCDLDLSLDDKGLLNAITYLGMISSAVMWGFLFDTLGRRKLLMIGFFLNALCIMMSFLAQNKILLIVSKFFGGFIINGPYAALSSYICEFQCAQFRARMQLLLGSISSCAGYVLPLVAWAILPQNIHIYLFNEALELHSWNFFLLACTVPAIVSTVLFIFLPESPKFLMTIGENEKALAIFQKIYSINTGRPTEEYPIKNLIDEIKMKQNNPSQHGGQVTAKRSQVEALKEGWQQIKPLFFPPFLVKLVLVCAIQTIFTMNLNTLRLWLPQIFQAMNDYQQFYNETSIDFCKSLEMIQPSNSTGECTVNTDNSSVYINSIITIVPSLPAFFLGAYFINIIGKKKLLCILGVINGGCVFAIYFSTSTTFAVAFSSIFQASGGVAINVILSIVIDLFPTTLRTMSLSLGLMCGRIGAMVGNLIFPILIRAGCMPPFFTTGSLVIGCIFLVMLLPNTDLKALE